MKTTPATHGFLRKSPPRPEDLRVPPGQHATQDFPVLAAGPMPQPGVKDWTLSLEFGNAFKTTWTWNEFQVLPQTISKTDIHCVTRWSKLDTIWTGVALDEIFRAADIVTAPAPYLMAHCDGGYTTNLPVEELIAGKAMIATHFNGEPLSPSHGGPARLLVPHLYFWKSAKWVRRLRFMQKDEPGFWESLGYHNHGDPWKEQRYVGD